MIIQYFHTVLLTVLFLNLSAQGLHDYDEKRLLLESKYKRIKVFKDGRLEYLVEIDRANKLVETHSLPVKSGTDSRIEYSTKYHFDSGRLVSVTVVDRPLDSILVDGPDGTSLVASMADSTETLFHYTNGGLLSKTEKFKKGNFRKPIATNYYGYDNKNRLILLSQNEGATKFYYTYNEKNQIDTETVHGVKITFKYNTQGQLESRESATQTIRYEYSTNGYLKRKTVTGSHPGDWTYEYE